MMKPLNSIWPTKKGRTDRHKLSDDASDIQLTSTPLPKSSDWQEPELKISPVAGDGNFCGQVCDSPELQLGVDEDRESDEDVIPIEKVADSFIAVGDWGLYPSVEKWYAHKGLKRLFQWQRDCLRADGVLDGGNLIFSAPTSAGKTMVADILLMKQVLNRQKRVLVVLPFVSIVREKVSDLESMLKNTHIRVGAFMGSFHTKGGFDSVHIAVTTFEKANGYINRLIQENRLDSLGAVIVDEIHLINDSSRGYLLELMLAKILMSNRLKQSTIQIIGMSATLPNVEDLGKWLEAYVYKTDFRPVPLTQMIQIGQNIVNAETLEVMESIPANFVETHKLKYLTMRCFGDNMSVLIFENNKKSIEASAVDLSRQIQQTASSQKSSNESENRRKVREVLSDLLKEKIAIIKDQLNNTSVKVDEDLMTAVEAGVAFHHAGLPMEHREIIEEAFKKGYIKILYATSTLSSGVNLPARKVIIKSPCDYTGKRMMDVLTYRQMIGRAGRKGMDEKGESILLCSKSEEEMGRALVQAQPSSIRSCLSRAEFSPCLQRAVLEAVVIGLIKFEDQVTDFMNCTLAMSQADEDMKIRLIRRRDEVMEYLTSKSNCFVTLIEEEHERKGLKAGQLGKAAVAAGLPPSEGLALMEHLKKARKGIVLTSDLHLLYLIIPTNSVANIRPKSERLKNLLMDFSQGGEFENCQDVVARLGLSYNSMSLSRETFDELKYKRFFVALALNDIINEHPIHELKSKYALDKGTLQSLQTSVSMFAGMVSSFCNKIGWSSMELLIRHLEARIEFGVQSDLIDLMRIPTMTVRVARRLCEASIDTVREIAHSTPSKILQILESKMELQSTSPLRRLSSMIWIDYHKRSMTLSEMTDFLVMEARAIIDRDVGPVDWDAGEKVASSQEAFKTPAKKSGKKVKQLTPVRALPVASISRVTLKEKVSLGRNSLWTDENLSTQHEDMAVTPVKVPSETKKNNDVVTSPVKSVFSSESSESSPTSTSSSSMAPKVLFAASGDVMRKRAADFSSSFSEKPACKRKLRGISNVPFLHNVRPAPVKRTDVTSSDEIKQIIDKWTRSRFAGVFIVEEKCHRQVPEIGARSKDVLSADDRYDGLIFQQEMRAFTRMFICLCENESFCLTGRQHLTEFGVLLKYSNIASMSVTAFDVKPVYTVFKECFGIDRDILLDMEWFDLRTCHWLKDPEDREPRSSMDLLKSPYRDMEAYVPFAKQFSKSFSFQTALLFPLRECLQTEILDQNSFDRVFSEIEVPVALLMAEAEARGIGVDTNHLMSLSQETSRAKKALEVKARQLAGVTKLNMASVKELKHILYTKLNLLSLISDKDIDKNEWRVKKMKETKGVPDHLSTGKRTLQTLSKYHPFPGLVIEYRKIQSARTKTIQHVEEYLNEINSNRIYTTFTTYSATGRIHMAEPDLQKTQNTFNVKVPTPHDTEIEQEFNVRKSFVPSEGHVFVSADYRQLELRILAHLSGDQKLLSILKSGGDVFSELAAQLNQKEAVLVTHEERQHAKTLVYGIIYGMGSLQLSHQLEVSEDEAKEFRDNFHNTFPGIQAYIDSVIDAADKSGYVETLVRRRRLLPAIHSNRGDDRAKARRQAVNTTIQGSAADLVKLAMIHLDEEIRSKRMTAFLVHEMHDELIYEVAEGHVNLFTKLISQTMEKVAETEFPDSFAVDLPVKVRTGVNWGQLIDVTVDA